MNTFELYIRGKRRRFSGPSGFSELTDHQTVSIMRFRQLVAQRPETLFVVLRMLYGMKRTDLKWLFDRHFLRRKGFDDETIDEALEIGQQLLGTLTWIGGDDLEACFPVEFRRYDFYYVTPLIQFKRWRNKTLYRGPQAGLGDCTFEEFMFADKAFRDNDWPQLAAILYRPLADGSTTERIPLDPSGVDERTRLFAQLHPALLERIAFGFGSTLHLLQRMFRLVFPETTTNSESDSKKRAKSAGWLDVAIGMAKLDVTKVGQVEKTNLYLAMKVLNEQLRQNEEMERELEKLKNK